MKTHGLCTHNRNCYVNVQHGECCVGYEHVAGSATWLAHGSRVYLGHGLFVCLHYREGGHVGCIDVHGVKKTMYYVLSNLLIYSLSFDDYVS